MGLIKNEAVQTSKLVFKTIPTPVETPNMNVGIAVLIVELGRQPQKHYFSINIDSYTIMIKEYCCNPYLQ